MQWVYLSPHFDDVALSCGGLVWDQTQNGQKVEIWTICAGGIPSGEISPFSQQLHARWQTGPDAVTQRRNEDLDACAILGAGYHHFDLPDAIYRRSRGENGYLYADEDSIFSPLERREEQTIVWLSNQIIELLPVGTQLICPLALGNHVDHQLVREAAQRTKHPLCYYPDYPYVIDNEAELVNLENKGWKRTIYPISSNAVKAWVESISAYSSQMSTFWQDREMMQRAIANYYRKYRGVCLLAQV